MTAAATAGNADEQPLRLVDRVMLALLLGGVRLLQALPESFVLRTAALIGRICYSAMPARRRLVRGNLRRVCVELASRGTGPERARTAATDDRALDALVRSAFEHWVRTYAESAIAPAADRRGGLLDRVELANPDVAERALRPPPGGRGVMYVGFHYGSVELAAAYAARRASLDIAGPMERLSNPALRAYFERTREQLGVRLLPVEDVAEHLTARLAAGQGVALVADRVIGGAGAAVTLFGAPARLPRGPAILAAETGAETYIVTMTRIGWDRWSARLDQLQVPQVGSRREKVAAAIADEVRILEETVSRAPDQWWSLFFPIWPEATTPKAHRRMNDVEETPTGAHPAAAATPNPMDDWGSADLHVHSMASDGIDGVEAILDAAVARGLSLLAITDHERVDGAVAARAMAIAKGLPIEVIVGEEITTRNGHLVALFMQERIGPWGSMRDSVRRVHEQGGIAIVAHPLVPYPLCASAGTIRRLLAADDPRVHPDGIEAFNPTTAAMRWAKRVPEFVIECGVAAVGGSDAHRASNVGQVVTRFSGHTTEDLRRAIAERQTTFEGSAYPWSEQFRLFGHQTRKNARALRDDVGGTLLRRGTGRDLGYPGSRRRPLSSKPGTIDA